MQMFDGTNQRYLDDLLTQIINDYNIITGNPDSFKEWANTPNDRLEGETPAAWFDGGKGTELLAMLEDIIEFGTE